MCYLHLAVPGCAQGMACVTMDAACIWLQLSSSNKHIHTWGLTSKAVDVVVSQSVSLCSTNRCDRDYGGVHCVPMAPLPFVLREDFNENLDPEIWPEMYGAERGMLSGEPLKSGTALIFKGVSNSCTLSSADL